MKKRRAYIVFPEQHGSSAVLLRGKNKFLAGLNVKFNVTYFSQIAIPAVMHIDIFNLNRTDLDFLSTSVANWLEKRSLMQLYAGYDDDVRLLWSGQIMDAIPSGAPDVVLRVSGISDTQWLVDNVSIAKDQIKVKDLIDYCADTMGYTLNWAKGLRESNEWLNKTLDTFSYTGSPMNLLARINEMCGGNVIGDRHLQISANNDELYVWSMNQKPDKSILLINKNTGMLGFPTPTAWGAKVTTLFNPSIKCGDVVRIESDRVKICNGDYFVIAATHEGEIRGNNFTTTLTCTRVEGAKNG